MGPKCRAPTLGDQQGGQASQRPKVGRGGSSRQLEDVQLEGSSGQLDGSKLLRLPGEQDGQAPRHGVLARPYQSQQLGGEGTGGSWGHRRVEVEARRGGLSSRWSRQGIELGYERGSRPWSDLGRCPGQRGRPARRVHGINKRDVRCHYNAEYDYSPRQRVNSAGIARQGTAVSSGASESRHCTRGSSRNPSGRRLSGLDAWADVWRRHTLRTRYRQGEMSPPGGQVVVCDIVQVGR